jgi:hypothetical protein
MGLAWSSLVLCALHVDQGLTGASGWLHGYAAMRLAWTSPSFYQSFAKAVALKWID